MNLKDRNYILLVLTNLVYELGYLPSLEKSIHCWNSKTFVRVKDVPIEWTAAIVLSDSKSLEKQERQWLLKRLMPQFQDEWLDYYYSKIHDHARKEWNEKVLSAVSYPIPDNKVV